ncbi:MAG: PEP-CTERM sorting domain-containing protein [Gemmatimonadota bacterium]
MLFSALLGSAVDGQQKIITFPGGTSGNGRGIGYNPTFHRWFSLGQTFTSSSAPARLLDFSFWLSTSSSLSPTIQPFFAYIVELSATNTVTRLHYKSAATQPPPVLPPGTPRTKYTFSVAGVVLNPNSTYLAFLSGFVPNTTPDRHATLLEYMPGNVYPGGSSFTAIDDPLTATWAPIADEDFAFEATLDAHVTPEPSVLLLLASGLGLLTAARRRRTHPGSTA